MGATVRKDREWWRVTLHQAGKRKCWHYKDRRVAHLKAKELDYRLAMEGWGFWEKPADENFQIYAKRQLEMWSNSLKPSTLHTWQHSLEHHVYPTFGAVPLNEITRAALKDFFIPLTKQGLRRYTLLNVLVPLRRILQEAVEEGRLAANPAAGIGRSVLPRNERPFEGKVYTPDQVQAYFRSANRSGLNVMLCYFALSKQVFG
jgi:integrase